MSEGARASGGQWWMVRAGKRGAELIDAFVTRGRAFIGFVSADLSEFPDKSDIRAKVAAQHPGEVPRRIYVWASQLHRFRSVFAKGDVVVTCDSKAGVYHVGTIVGDYRFDPTGPLPHVRNVEWTHRVSRADLSPAALNSLGSVLAIFAIPDGARAELEAQMEGSEMKSDGRPSPGAGFRSRPR